MEQEIMKGLAGMVPPVGEAETIADAIVKGVAPRWANRPIRMPADLAEDSAEAVSAV